MPQRRQRRTHGPGPRRGRAHDRHDGTATPRAAVVGIAGMALGAALVLGAASCTTRAPEQVTETDGADASPLDADASPLTAYLEAALGEGAGSPRATWDREQELIAACMKERGFEYTPVPYPEGEDSDGRSTREDAADHGYNVVARSSTPPPAPPPDPNVTYVESLSPSAREEYDLSYLGAPDANPTDPDQQGCAYAATLAAGQADVWNAAQFAALNHELARRWDAVEQDPRVLAAVDAWSECMADAGHPGMVTMDDPMFLIEERFRAELGNVYREGDARAAALADDERALAVTDVDCKESAGYWDAQDAAQADWENAFIERNRVDLEALVGALQETEAADE